MKISKPCNLRIGAKVLFQRTDLVRQLIADPTQML